MESILLMKSIPLVIISLIIAFIWFISRWNNNKQLHTGSIQRYFYGRKDSVMTNAEKNFYYKLTSVCQEKYYVFPQIHLSALLYNQTKNKYRKLAFQRINRTSVDFVLARKDTLETIYAIELDDSTHDSTIRQARDRGVDEMLANAHITLVRFRNATNISDDAIINALADARQARSAPKQSVI